MAPETSVSPLRRAAMVAYRPFARFLDTETRSGTLLMLATVVAVVWANSPWSDLYSALWQLRIVAGPAGHALDLPVISWLNDLLMAAFFLLVGLEIKRELVIGELNSPRRAALPIAAAIGGMIVPASIYALIAGRGDTASGWGVPMATDIAFAIGVARLLGDRVPSALLVFLTAFAIIDDLGAVLVIALFYGHEPSWLHLGVAGALTAILVAMNKLGVSRGTLYVLLGLPLWYAVHESGVHATVAGVIVGLCVPARPKLTATAALAETRSIVTDASARDDDDDAGALEAIEHHVEEAQSPLSRLEHGLHPYVAYVIIPLFALANAGVDVRGSSFAAVVHPVTLGVIFGLIVGKPLGILTASWVSVRLGIAELPSGFGWPHLAGASVLGGIGFTMSLFVADLAFHAEPGLLAAAKVGVLLGSAVAAAGGLWLLSRPTRTGP